MRPIKSNQQTAYGGRSPEVTSPARWHRRTSTGQKHFDFYKATTKPGGDVSKAKAQLKLCGWPNGFSTGIA